MHPISTGYLPPPLTEPSSSTDLYLDYSKELLTQRLQPDVYGRNRLHTFAGERESFLWLEFCMAMDHFFTKEEIQTYCNQQDVKNGFTPLHLAAIEGNESMIAQLIVQGASINLQDFYGRTPLNHACMQQHFGSAELLCSSSLADPLIEDTSHFSPLLLSVYRSNFELFRLLHRHLVTLTQRAEARTLSDDLIQEPLKKLRCFDGMNLLHYAATTGAKEIVDYLLTMGFALTDLDDKKRMPIHHAVAKGHMHLLGSLTSADTRANKDSNQALTVQMCAVMAGSVEVVGALFELGYDFSQPLQAGETPAHVAAFFKKSEIFQMLQDLSVDVTVPNEAGQIPEI